ncbi:MAG: aminotransferase class I/II-fold pyridoxal phosphate-dependent enzyme [Christensenellaceae bacterium]|jgi:DNA-binding transcriptional MocR family regulator|nr:aminotransferase class I/II-fold pyridoxal phosphate-dependent enzyme [Christensenellaceae bacterium]
MNNKLNRNEIEALLAKELKRFSEFKSKGLKLDMSRGKPCEAQLDLSQGLFDTLTSKSLVKGIQDYRNYGLIDGIPELKKIIAELIDVETNELILAGNSSLNLMYDSVQRAMQFGVLGHAPFNKQGNIKWLCVVPGYDRHFAVTQCFGIEMINIQMNSDGPDMHAIEIAITDPAVKGIWCVPKYSNPQGVVFSDAVVERFAKLKPAAPDFRIYWDNAYMMHTLEKTDADLMNILWAAKKYDNEDIVYIFGSTSKISFAGGGVAFIASSSKNIADIKKHMAFQTIGHDKINQYAHYLFFKNADTIKKHMLKHAKIIAPKFETVLNVLDSELKNLGFASWIKPRGGYFISCDLAKNTAKRAVQLAKEAGVIFTPAGSTYPYGIDPNDSNVRIAPTLPNIDDLTIAMQVFCCCGKIAYFENILKQK